jgi:hypothetical protein
MQKKFILNKENNLFEVFEFFCLLLLSLDLSLNLVPLSVYFLIFVLLAYKSSRVEMSFILVFFPGMMIVETLYGMGYGIFLLLLITGVMIISNEVWKQRFKIILSIIPLFIVLAGFIITYIYAPKGRYSAEKMFYLISNGIVSFLYFAIFIKSGKFNNLRFALFLSFIYIFLAKVGIQNSILHSPLNFYDFGFIRYSLLESQDSKGYMDYNGFGNLALFSVIFLLASDKKINWLYSCLIVFSFYLALLAGARQMIYGIIVILIIHLISNIKSWKPGQVIFYAIFSVLIITILESKNIPFLSDFLLSKDVVETAGGRSEFYERAISLFKEKPFLGNGMGGFTPNGENRIYPHNIILEIMAEGGIFMFALIFLSCYVAKQRSSFRFGAKTENGTLYLYLLLGFGVKSFSSSDLEDNIALISCLMAIGIFERVYFHQDCCVSVTQPPKESLPC